MRDDRDFRKIKAWLNRAVLIKDYCRTETVIIPLPCDPIRRFNPTRRKRDPGGVIAIVNRHPDPRAISLPASMNPIQEDPAGLRRCSPI
jgi:hypothetical protein